MNHRTMLTAMAATALTAPAFAGYTVTQSSSAPTYTDQSLDFDEPGGPTGVVSTDAWASLGLTEMQAGDGVPQVDDWDAIFGPWIGDANAFYGNFGVFMTFDGDLSALSCQVWDPAGPPSPFGGGLGVFLFNDGVEVSFTSHEPAWGGLGDSWFDIVAADGCVFDEVRILGFGFPATTFVDNISWKNAPCYIVTQGASAPTYTDRSLNFDEPGGPTGVVPADSWDSLGLTEMQAGDGVPQVDDWDAIFGPWIGDANAFYGNFGVFMTFDGDLCALSCQVWDPAGPPSPFGGGLGVFLFNDGVEVSFTFHEPAWGGIGDEWFDIVAVDGCVFDEVRILGFGFPATTFIDNITWKEAAASTLEMALDIKPGSCPNSFNRNSNGVLPVGLLGGDVDANDVDLASIALTRADGVGGSVAPIEGPPGPHSTISDVGTPFDGVDCDCHEAEGDGIDDLSMKFRTQDVVDALEMDDLGAGDLVELVVSGTLLDGTPFTSSDCIRLVPPGTAPGMLTVNTSARQAWIDVSPLDLQLDGGGFGSFDRTYPLGSEVTVTAAAQHQGAPFIGWLVEGRFATRTGATMTIVVDGEIVDVVAVYGTRPNVSPDSATPPGASNDGAGSLTPH